jgi:hypothetical protein
MTRNLMTITMVVAVSSGLAFVGGCESDAQTGALLGTGIGAGVGAFQLFRCPSEGRVSAMSAQEASTTTSCPPKTS